MLGTLKWYAESLIATLLVTPPDILSGALWLAVVAYFDSRYREIPDEVLLLGLIPALGAIYINRFTIEVYPFTVVFIVTIIGVSLAFFFLGRLKGVMASGDPIILSIAGLAFIRPLYMRGGIIAPVILPILVFQLAYPIIEIVINVYHNTVKRALFEELTLGMSKWRKAYYFISTRVMTEEEFRRSRFLFPRLTREGFNEINIEVDPLTGKEYSISGPVLAVPAMPLGTSLFVGFLIFAVVMIVDPFLVISLPPCVTH